MQPALDYFKELLDSTLKEQISVFKAVRVFNPQKVAMLKPDVSHVNAQMAGEVNKLSHKGDDSWHQHFHVYCWV